MLDIAREKSETAKRWTVVLATGALLGLAGCAEWDDRSAWEDAWDELHGEPRTGCSGVVPPDGGPFGMRVALTFDDGPDLTDTPAVLDILEAHGARGTFFINGRNVDSEADWALLHEMVERGHTLANHTHTHPNALSISASSFDSEIERTHDVLVEVLDEHGQQPRFFRFPYGAADCDRVAAVEDWGYHVVGWHVDTADWCFQSSTGGYGYCSPSTFGSVPSAYRDDFVGLALSQADSRDGGIVLFHDVHRYTVDHLDGLLTRFEQEGYAFTTLDDVATFPLLNGETPPPQPWVGDPCEVDEDCDFAAGGAWGYCHRFDDLEGDGQLGFCALPCDGYCPDRGGEAPTFCVASDDPEVGRCVSKTDDRNDWCEAIPGTVPQVEDRFVWTSGAPAASAEVCVEAP